MIPITFIQTSDAIFYYDMMIQTSRTVRNYCIENGFRYESYVGVKRGHMPWQATYNRIYMLKELLDRGVTGWIFYVDADAMIGDTSFDLRHYLDDKHSYAGIFAGDHAVPYHINAGGFAINLSHTYGRKLVLDYWNAVEAISESEFDNAAIWGKSIPEDQLMLHLILKRYVTELEIGYAFLFERANESFVNHGPFIRQHLRSRAPNFRARMVDITREVDEAVSGRTIDWPLDGPGYYFPAAHPRLKTDIGLKDAISICSTGKAGTLIYGPYISLKAGNYVIRLFGEIRIPRANSPMVIALRVTSDSGKVLWSTYELENIQPVKGLILEHYFSLPQDIDFAETCVFIDEKQDIDVTAVQIHWTDQWVDEN
ncbi:hypothetical protein [Gluconacetobacter sp.]|uniref:hypothetical protein n=1 Tax=Gluconacetobacter sp. TaxID=1935994 RepID=UPI0039ECF55F